MNARITASAAALMAAIILTGCSENGSGIAADPISEIDPETVISTSLSDTASVGSSLEENDKRSDDQSSSTDEYEKMKATISDSYVFESYAEKVAFSQLMNEGLANVTGSGSAYAIVFSSGGAGKLFYDTYYTTDGGSTWEQGEPLTIYNGTISRFATEDGRIVMIDHASAMFEDAPIVEIIGSNEDHKLTVEEKKDWFDKLDFDKDQPYNAYAKYLGGYKLELTIKQQSDASESETELFHDDITLDSETLMPLI